MLYIYQIIDYKRLPDAQEWLCALRMLVLSSGQPTAQAEAHKQ